MGSLFQELKRRNVVRVGVAYLALVWVVLQVTELAVPALNLPESLNSTVFYLGLIGLPFALFFAWAFELTPEGLMKTEDVDTSSSVTHSTGRKLDFIIIGLLAIAVSWLAIDRFAEGGESQQQADGASSAIDKSTALAELLASLPEIDQTSIDKAIAVLPLANLSPDPDNAYFAAGIHEEILNQLAKIADLRVISRTTMLRYENSDLSTSEIAAELNVGTVMEGSVRYADNQVKITTQLIRASDDSHIWSESYERELADIFAIQSDVAISVADALQANLLAETRADIQRPASSSTDAFSLFLQTRYRQEQAFNRRDFADDGWIQLGIRDMRRAIDLDPGFSRAYAELAFLLYARTEPESGLAEDRESWLQERETLARRALEIDPELGRAYDQLAIVYSDKRQWAEAKTYNELAIGVPNPEPRLFGNYALHEGWLGHYESAYSLVQRGIELDPTSVLLWNRLAQITSDNRDYQGTLLAAERMRSLGLERPYHFWRAAIFYRLDRPQEALSELRERGITGPDGLIGGGMFPSSVYILCKLGYSQELEDYLAALDSNLGLEGLTITIALDTCQGDINGAFNGIQQLIELEQNVIFPSAEFDELRQDSRWHVVEEYMNFPDQD